MSNPAPTPSAPIFDPFVNYDANDYLTQEERDEIIARRLQAEEDGAFNSSSSDVNDSINRDTIALPQSTLANYVASGGLSDEEMARKIEIEMQDEIYAAQLQQNEQMQQMKISTTRNDIERARLEQDRSCSRKRWYSAVTTLIVVAGAGVFILFYGETIWNRLGGGSQVPPFFTWEDDDNPASEEFKSWRTKKTGLKLTIVNAMTSDWYEFFDEAVADWNLSPSLSLSVQMATADPTCRYIPGKLKACNDDYGKTGWSGLNEAWMDGNGYITASTAKMNENYLKNAGVFEKLYVVCHEIGHGFGLPHRDTNVMNQNLGTCLDYTSNFKSNMKPDAVDFQNLEKLYGVGKRRNMRVVDMIEKDSNIPIGNLNDGSYLSGRLLYKSGYKEVYQEDLADGGKKITTLLLAGTS